MLFPVCQGQEVTGTKRGGLASIVGSIGKKVRGAGLLSKPLGALWTIFLPIRRKIITTVIINVPSYVIRWFEPGLVLFNQMQRSQFITD